jgi:hypothetical protein
MASFRKVLTLSPTLVADYQTKLPDKKLLQAKWEEILEGLGKYRTKLAPMVRVLFYNTFILKLVVQDSKLLKIGFCQNESFLYHYAISKFQ